MTTIIGNKVGTSVNLLIDGNIYNKQCATLEQADAFFKLVINAKKGGKQELDLLMNELNRMHRIVVNGILEKDNSDQFYLKGFNHPIPELLLNTFTEYLEKDFPIDAILNFWKLLMLNPDKTVRDGLFDFLSHYQFAITDNGYFIAYKIVKIFSQGISDKDLITFVNQKFEQLKKWKKSPKNYNVLYDIESKTYSVIFGNDHEIDHDLTIYKGNLDVLHDEISKSNSNNGEVIYTDKHSETTRIILGSPVQKERMPEFHKAECSENGLHVGSTPYIEGSFYSQGDTVLMVLVNPAHVVHVPSSETTKLRTAEYYPYAIIEKNDSNEKGNKFKVLTQPYFELDYANYEREKLEEQLDHIRDEERNGAESTPSQIDYKKIMETRLVDLNVLLNLDKGNGMDSDDPDNNESH